MFSKRQSGLMGKARQNHTRGRFEAKMAQHFIDEWAEPVDGRPLADRYVPVRHHSPALATLAVPGGAPEPSLLEQMELPLTFAEEAAAVPRNGNATTRQNGNGTKRTSEPFAHQAKAAPAQPAPVKPSEQPIPVIRAFPGRHGLSRPERPVNERPRIRIGGLLFGCLIGGSAAAAVLLIVNALL